MESDNHEFIGLNSLMFVLIVCICLFLSHFIKQYKISYLSESGAAMLFGLFVGGILSNFTKEEITFVHFNPEIFLLHFATTHNLRGRIFVEAEALLPKHVH